MAGFMADFMVGFVVGFVVDVMAIPRETRGVLGRASLRDPVAGGWTRSAYAKP